MTPAGRAGRRVHVGGEREHEGRVGGAVEEGERVECTMAEEMAARWWLKKERVEARLVP